MKALILNSGLGRRMGVLSSEHPKCMTEITPSETILSRQLLQLVDYGIEEVVITTGYFDKVLIDYCNFLQLPLRITYVNNPIYDKTNYIFSIYCARAFLQDDDILLMHGDLVFDNLVLEKCLENLDSCMVVSSTLPLPLKDFKAVIRDGIIKKVGVEFFDNALAAQPLYKLKKEDWLVWLRSIESFCESGEVRCYAENAFNVVSDMCALKPLDVKDMLCSEIDTQDDYAIISDKLRAVNDRKVYMCFASDFIHSGHISIIKKAKRLGTLTVGVLSDEAVASYKRFPFIPFEERKALMSNLTWVDAVIEQKSLSYADNLRALKPDYVVHGDDWREGVQKPIRQEVLEVLEEYGGQLVEYPYSDNPKLKELDRRSNELKISSGDK